MAASFWFQMIRMPSELVRLRSGFSSAFGSFESDMFEKRMEEGIGALRYTTFRSVRFGDAEDRRLGRRPHYTW